MCKTKRSVVLPSDVMDLVFDAKVPPWSSFSWKFACYGLTILVVAQFLSIWRGFRHWDLRVEIPASASATSANISGAIGNGLHLIESSHGKVSGDGLTAEQCQSIFPNLYTPVDQAVEYWKRRAHVISKEDTNVSYRSTTKDEAQRGAAMRILIHHNELRILESLDPTINNLSSRERAIGALFNIYNALQSATAGGETLPAIEAALVFLDQSDYPTVNGTHSTWAWAANISDESHQRHWLMPNFDFWYSARLGPYFSEARRRAMVHNQTWIQKIPKAVWRGSKVLNPELRGTLLNVTKDKDWADVHAVFAINGDSEFYLPIEELCKYAFTIHTEGTTYSGRLKFLLNCNSVPIVHELEWMTDWYHLLKDSGPDQNYVKVKRDWSDLEQKIKYYLDRPDEAQRIIDNHLATFRNRYLTRAAQSCYIRALIRGYSSVSFKPEVYRETRADESKSRIPRGDPFEHFMYMPEDFVEDSLY